jgi:hypothetical protein
MVPRIIIDVVMIPIQVTNLRQKEGGFPPGFIISLIDFTDNSKSSSDFETEIGSFEFTFHD